VVPRVKELCTAGFVGDQTTAPDSSDSQLVDPPDEIRLTSIVGDVTLTDFAIDVESYSVDQLQLQIELKKIAVHVAFWRQLFRPQQKGGYRGLPDLVSPEQIVAAGGALTLDAMDDLVARVTEGDAEMTSRVIVMNTRTFVAYARARRAAALTMEYAMRESRRYAVHNGATILVSDFVPHDRGLREAGHGQTSVWCFTLGHEHNGVFGVIPPDVGEDGLVVEKVEGGPTADTVIYRVRWYTAVIVGQPTGLACLDGVRLG
jgi:hypothetical protein